MESTKMIESLRTLRAGFEKPPSDMEIIRRSLVNQVAKLHEVEMPPLLTQEQRKTFSADLECLEAFLKSEDGADAIELLVGAFSRFSEEYRRQHAEAGQENKA